LDAGLDLILQTALCLIGMNTRWLRGLTAALIGLSCIAPDAARAFHIPENHQVPLMVGLGDSISAGALADTSTQKSLPIPWGLPIPSLDNPLDGIGFKSDFENKRTYSWVSGLVVHSHYRRLQEFMKAQGKRIWALNFAESGAVSAKALAQAGEVETAVKLGLFNSIPYVTLLIGANDLCKSVPLETFRQNVHGIFEKIAAIRTGEGQPRRVLVSSIPRIADLGESRIMDYRTAGGYSCRAIRSTRVSVCKRMTQWKTAEEHQKLNTLVDQANEILKDETLEAARKYPVLETYFSQVLSETNLDATDLAMDCFHPNSTGQEKIAESLWKDQPWFK
jgi:lysophospholipase L1-like esterase